MISAICALLLAGAQLPSGLGPDRVEFARDVRPILSQNCYQCHGPDAESRQADLRLDVAGGPADGRPIVIPGRPDESELFRRVSAPDADERMPPREANKELSAEQVEMLRRWIEQGGELRGHWSFEPIERPEVPDVERHAWPRGPIDHFVLAELEARGLEPSSEADARTLVRRVTLDLIGLPPTPAEIRAFELDNRPDAYERVVDRLLASSAYAERMTLAWMDAARYGDTSVFHADGPRDMWPWRDWVIEAYAANMPFDRFTVEQLAGDLLPHATQGSRVASGFHRNCGTSDEGGAIDEELRVLYMVDRVKTTSNVWLGLSMECGQCHEHKFDPISHADYYRFYAFFNQSLEKGFQTRTGNEPPLERVASADEQSRDERLAREIAGAHSFLANAAPPADELAAWIEAQAAQLAELEEPELGTWSSLGPFTAASGREAFEKEIGPETSLDLAASYGPAGGLSFEPRADWPDARPHSLDLPDSSAIYLHRTISVERPTRRSASLGSDDTIQVWLNGELLLAREVYRGTLPDQDRVALDLCAGANQFLMKVCNGAGASGFYFELLGPPLPDEVIAALRTDEGAREPEQREAIRAHYAKTVWPPGVEKNAELDALLEEREALRGRIPTVMVMQDVPEGRPTYVLERGEYDRPLLDRPVEPGVLDFLLPLPEGAPRNRLGLARWLVHPDHPLTARVAVNRYWAMLLGTGIVSTVMDFGSQGEWPSHPELLDWLADDFVASGWNVKRTLRQIVTSATYRQSSRRRAELDRVDPENRLLGRAPRFRLQGEFLRDQALAVSGLLVDRVGGPGVKPYQPPGLWNEVSLDKDVRFTQDSGEKLYRKSMYIYWKRSAPMPAMTTFDAPTREKCVVQRQRTNTPLQALVTLNDVQFVEAARHLAERMLRAGDSFEARVDRGFELCTSRPASASRREVARTTLDEQLATYRADPASAAALLAVGESERDATLDAAEHAAWTVLASMLLNLDETLNRE